MEEKNAKKIINLMKKYLEKNNIKYVDYLFAPLGTVIANHTGPGSVGILWVKKQTKND